MRKNITEKIADVELEIEQLISLKKELIAKHKEEERRARTKRLCERAGYLESILPDTVTLTKEQFQTFLDKTLLTGFAEKILKGIITQTPDPAAEKSTGTAA